MRFPENVFFSPIFSFTKCVTAVVLLSFFESVLFIRLCVLCVCVLGCARWMAFHHAVLLNGELGEQTLRVFRFLLLLENCRCFAESYSPLDSSEA